MTSSDPVTVSIVIPARDEATYIERALDSIIRQDYPLHHLECTVVDNASSDATAEVAWNFALRHPVVATAVIDEPVPGVGRAKNRGAEAARGPILIFLDADSRMEPSLVRRVVAHWQAGHRAGSIRVAADSQHPLERGYFALMEVGKLLFGVRSQMMYCERELFLELGGFNPDLRLAEDLEFLRRVKNHLQAQGRTVHHVRDSAILTSTRRMRQLPFHLGIGVMFVRWILAFAGIGRTREY